MLTGPTSLTRRSLVLGGLGAVAAVGAGCDAVPGLGGDDDPPGASGAVTPTAPAADADAVLAADTARLVAQAGALAAATAAAVPELAPNARRLARLHEAHAAELGWSGTLERPSAPGTRAAGLRRLSRSEARLQERLVAAALAAESGGLAQVLASMAAAVAQQRAVLG